MGQTIVLPASRRAPEPCALRALALAVVALFTCAEVCRAQGAEPSDEQAARTDPLPAPGAPPLEQLNADVALPPLPDELGLPALEPARASVEQRWLSHEIALDASIYPGELPAGVDRAWFELSYRPRLSGALGAGFSLTAELLLRASQARRGGQAKPRSEGNGFRLFSGSYHSNADRQALLFKEAQLSWAGHGCELLVGYQIFSWGKADGVRPLDVFRVEDRSDPLRAETLGLPAVSASYGLHGFVLEGVWAPFAFSDRLALHAQNPWSLVPREPGVRFADTRRALRWRDGEFGGRISYSGQSWELALQSSRTRERTPSFMQLVPDANGITLTPTYARQWLHGASLLRTIDRFLLKLDVAYVDYARGRRRLLNDGVRLVAGGEVRGQLGENGNYTAILQYALDTTTPGALRHAGSLVSSPYRWFRHAALAKLRAQFSPRFDAELSALVELVTGSTVASATLRYHPNDGTSLFCEGSFIAGRKQSWLSRIDFADRMIVGVTFNFNS